MKLNPSMGGYFEKGKFIPFEENKDNCDLFSCLNKEIQASIKQLEKICHDNLAINSVCIPDLTGNEEIFETNILLILREAYLSIALGNYNAGLLLLGQLLEVVTKEIILINTGKSLPQASFGQAIRHAEDKKILYDEDIQFLKQFNENIRNIYSHYKLSEIIGPDIRVPLWKISLDPNEKFDPEKFLLQISELQKGIREGKHKPTFVDPLELPAVAATIKENIDRKKAIWWLWWINIKLDQFSKIYLTQEKYQEYIRKFGKIAYNEVLPIPFSN